MNLTARIACLCLMVSAALPVLGTRALAQGVGRDDFFLGARELVWTGRVAGSDGQFQDTPLSKTLARDLRKELAEIQVSIDVDRKLEDARKKLDDLAIRATRRGYDGRKDVLVEVALARSTLLETLGKPADAKQAVVSVLLNGPMPAGKPRYEFVAADDQDKQLYRLVTEDPRLVAQRAKLEGATARVAAGDAQDKIEQIVRNALERGDTQLQADLGDRAIPALEKQILQNLDALPEQNKDALWHYVRLSSARSADFIRAHFDEGGPVWKARILRALGPNALFNGHDDWIFVSSDQPRRLAKPQWLPVLEKLLRDPTTAREALHHMGAIVQNDALTPGLQRALSDLLTSTDVQVSDRTLAVLSNASGRASVEPVMAAGLRSPRPEIRDLAATRLSEYASSPGLLAAAGSDDPAVRVQVALSLRGRHVAVPNHGNGTTGRNWTNPPLGAREREVLEKLIADPDPDVRAEAAVSIARLDAPLQSGVYEKISRDPDARVRGALLFANSVPVDIRARIAMALAADADERVLDSFDEFLFSQPAVEDSDFEIDPSFLPAIQVRRTNRAKTMPVSNGRNNADQLYSAIVRTPAGLAAMGSWVAQDQGEQVARFVIDQVSQRVSRAQGSRAWSRGMLKASDAGIEIDRSNWVPVFEASLSNPNVRQDQAVTQALVTLDEDLSADFIPIAADASRSAHVRLAALDIAANGSDPRIGPLLSAILSDAAWRANKMPSGWDTEMVASVAAALPLEPARKVLLSVLADRSTPDFFASSMAAGFASSKPLDERLADAVLERLFEFQGANRSGIAAALKQVATRPLLERGDWLARAARHPGYFELAFELIGDTHDPQYFGLLEESLSPDLSLFQIDRTRFQDAALNALTRYFDQRAADLILKVAGTTANAGLRDRCFKALETIRKYQEEKGRWEGDRESKQATATAVRDLVTLLDDKDAAVRAQAVRGLATLNAVQEMPRIVRMLKDADEGVRKAADQALSVLNQPPKKD